MSRYAYAQFLFGLNAALVCFGVGTLGAHGERMRSLPIEKPYAPIRFSVEESRPVQHNPLPSDWSGVDLSGSWKLVRLPDTEGNPVEDEGMRAGFWRMDYDAGRWEEAVVPTPFWDYEKGDGRPQVGWYRKKVVISKRQAGTRALLRFEGVSYEATVWVNGAKAGLHRGRYARFQFDITDLILWGEENTIAVRVYYQRYGSDSETVSWRGPSGIWQPVRLVFTGPVYGTRCLVTPHLADSSIAIDYQVVNPGARTVRVKLRAVVTPVGGVGARGRARAIQKNLGEYELSPGTRELQFTVKIERPVLWEPANPFLYCLEIKDATGTEYRTRFGFREFVARGPYFYLNGKRIYLTGCWLMARHMFYQRPEYFHTPDGRLFTQKHLLALKKANVMIARTHTSPTLNAFYDLCDEVGFLVYDEWPGVFHCSREFADYSKTEIVEWVYQNYNHPSMAIWNFGNEYYDVYVKTTNPYWAETGYQPYLNQLYDTVRKLDKTGRPISRSSGRACILGDKTDVEDWHNYAADQTSSWPALEQTIDYYYQKNAEVNGQRKPMMAFEHTDFSPWGIDPAAEWERIRAFLEKEPVDKTGYIAYVHRMDATKRLPSRFGIRNLRPGRIHKACAEDTRRKLELFRLAGDKMAGTGPFILTRVIAPWWGENLAGMEAPFAMRVFRQSPQFYTFRRCFNPTFVVAEPFDRNLIAGEKLQARVWAINDAPTELKPCVVAAAVFSSDGKACLRKEFSLGKIAANSRQGVTLSWLVPQSLPTAFYDLALFMDEASRTVSYNVYRFFVMSPRSLRTQIQTGRKVALYDKGDNTSQAESPSTTMVLRKLRIPFNQVEDFTTLRDYDVLILGSDSFDNVVLQGGQRIREWINHGGRLLCLEQTMAVPLPWAPSMCLFPGSRTLVDPIVSAHPVFQGLTPENWDTWNDRGRGFIYKMTVAPLNASLLATGESSNSYEDPEDTKMVISEARLGDGTALVSQVDAVRRYGDDCIATKYLQNLLDYVLTSDMPCATPIAEEKTPTTSIEPGNCYPIDLRDHTNMGFRDEVAGDQKGGWDDDGSNDMRNLPTGEQTLAGVPFLVIKPEDNQGRSCIVLRGGQHGTFLPEKATGIGLGDKLIDNLYFLHACTWGSGEGELLARYVIHYQDGANAEVDVRHRISVADWHQMPKLPEAEIAWLGANPVHSPVGLYLLKWQNPYSNRPLHSLDFVSAKSGGVPILVAVTAEWHKRPGAVPE